MYSREISIKDFNVIRECVKRERVNSDGSPLSETEIEKIASEWAYLVSIGSLDMEDMNVDTEE